MTDCGKQLTCPRGGGEVTYVTPTHCGVSWLLLRLRNEHWSMHSVRLEASMLSMPPSLKTVEHAIS
jgi:hypothetical protein